MKTAKIILLLALAALCFMACTNMSSVKTIDANQLEQQLAQTSGAQLVDVRTAEEYAESHISGAINSNVNDEEGFTQQMALLDKTQPVLVYCRTGKRSAKAASILEKQGFTSIYNLDGGITAWKEQGKPVAAE